MFRNLFCAVHKKSAVYSLIFSVHLRQNNVRVLTFYMYIQYIKIEKIVKHTYPERKETYSYVHLLYVYCIGSIQCIYTEHIQYNTYTLYCTERSACSSNSLHQYLQLLRSLQLQKHCSALQFATAGCHVLYSVSALYSCAGSRVCPLSTGNV